MIEGEIGVRHGGDEIPELCPDCGREYGRTWTNDARPLGRRYQRFEHTGESSEYCMVLIDRNEGG